MNEIINFMGSIGAIAALMLLFGFNRLFETHSRWTLMIGRLLIALSAWEFSFLDIGKAFFETANKGHIDAPSDYTSAIRTIEILKFAFGGGILSLGTNIIAAWFTANQALSKK